MGVSCILTGMILNVMPVGEYDKRITILTRERGKITAFARGARRPKSSMQAATNLFCFGKFEAYVGRDSYTVVRAEISHYFRELTTDLDLTYYGCYFLELADYFTQENNDGVNQLKLLYQTLRALNVKSLDHKLVRCIYELKSLVYFGVYPNVFSCKNCGSKENLHLFDMVSASVLCDHCRGNQSGDYLDDASIYTLQYIIASPVEKLYTFTVTEEVFEKVSRIVRKYMKQYVEKDFKTLLFLQ
jgi:DNA repair protein RecO (recombination protein O)